VIQKGVIMGGKGSGRKKAIRVNIDPAILTDKEILTIALGKPLAEKLQRSEKPRKEK
jgi:hypothetical protein